MRISCMNLTNLGGLELTGELSHLVTPPSQIVLNPHPLFHHLRLLF